LGIRQPGDASTIPALPAGSEKSRGDAEDYRGSADPMVSTTAPLARDQSPEAAIRQMID